MTAELPVILKGERYHALCQGYREDYTSIITFEDKGQKTNKVCTWVGVAYVGRGREFSESETYEQIGFETNFYPVWENSKKNYIPKDAIVDFHQRAPIPGNANINSFRPLHYGGKDHMPEIIDLAISAMVGAYRLAPDKLYLVQLEPLNLKDLVRRSLCAAGTIDMRGHKHLLLPPAVKI